MKILLTGAAGEVGRLLRPLLSDKYASVLLTDRVPIEDLRFNETFEQGDICDASFMDSLLGKVDGVIHLAALVGPDYTFEQVLGPNVEGTHNLLRAAVQQGVRRVVYASSHHAVGFLPRGTPIDAETPPRADSNYGISKAFGEILCSHFADAYGLDVLSIRIGFVGEQVIDERRIHTWCSPRDLVQLIDIGLTYPDLGYRIVYGCSESPSSFFDNGAAEALGYRPVDNVLDHLADPGLLHASVDESRLENCFVGGHFVSTAARSTRERRHAAGQVMA